MQTYARVVDGVVVELFSTAQPMAQLFHPALNWVPVGGQKVAVGFVQQGGGFVPPPAAPALPHVPSLAELQAEIAALAAKVAALG